MRVSSSRLKQTGKFKASLGTVLAACLKTKCLKGWRIAQLSGRALRRPWVQCPVPKQDRRGR